MAKARPLDPARLYEAMVYSAYMVEQYGDEYAWVLDRLETEWLSYLSREAPRMRARRILDAHTLDGGLKAIR